MSMRAVYGIVAREFVRFLRQRGRVLASIGRPFVWLVFAGGGFAAGVARGDEIDYPAFMGPRPAGKGGGFGPLRPGPLPFGRWLGGVAPPGALRPHPRGAG